MASILVVDDDPQHCNMAAQMLRLLGHRVSVASNGADALASYRAQPVDLVITDILMPGTDGIELILALRALTPPPRVLAMSGGSRNYPRDFTLGSAVRQGADAILNKPFTRAELEAALKSLL